MAPPCSSARPAERTPSNCLSSRRSASHRDGRVEVLFGDGSTLHLDIASTVDFQSDELIRLTRGSRAPEHHGPRSSRRLPRRCPARPRSRSTSRANTASPLDGTARPSWSSPCFAARRSCSTTRDHAAARRRARVRQRRCWRRRTPTSTTRRAGTLRSLVARRGVMRGSASRRSICPTTVRAYSSTFDRDGDWQYDAVVRLRLVSARRVGWRPYYYGRWASYPRYGWTWIGADPFAWPTHHYGRWGFSAGVVVLDSVVALGPGVGLLGLRARLRELVSARFRQPAGLRDQRLRRSRLRPVARLDRRALLASARGHVNQHAVNWDRVDAQRRRVRGRAAAPGFRARRGPAKPRRSAWAGARRSAG